MRGAVIALVVAMGLSLAPGAGAHSILLESTPGANTVVAPPTRIVLRFNNRIEKALSRMQVTDARGRRLDLRILEEGPPEEVRAEVAPLPPGRVLVEWHVLSTDGHVVDGSLAFRVGP